jgi:hypothetical protein
MALETKTSLTVVKNSEIEKYSRDLGSVIMFFCVIVDLTLKLIVHSLFLRVHVTF